MDSPAPADVSVIIAAYNAETTITRAIQSAFDQENVRVEVIVIDDCSTDATVRVAERISDQRLKIMRRHANGGPSIARNEGIAAASAPWIAVLDADDAFAPHRFTLCLQRAASLKADIVIDNLEVRREADNARFLMFKSQNFARKPSLDLATFIRGNLSFLGGGALGYVKPVFASAFLKKHRLAYTPGLHIGEDYKLLAEALACGGRCAIEPTAGYIYTIRAGSLSHRLSADDIARIREADRSFLSRHALDAAAAKAQGRRESGLKTAFAFIRLIDKLKHQDLSGAVAIGLGHPAALWHLWRPAVARIGRLWQKLSYNPKNKEGTHVGTAERA